jgi:hypothetical protein
MSHRRYCSGASAFGGWSFDGDSAEHNPCCSCASRAKADFDSNGGADRGR